MTAPGLLRHSRTHRNVAAAAPRRFRISRALDRQEDQWLLAKNTSRSMVDAIRSELAPQGISVGRVDYHPYEYLVTVDVTAPADTMWGAGKLKGWRAEILPGSSQAKEKGA